MKRALARSHQVIEREITVGHGIETITGRLREAEGACRHVAIDIEPRSGQCCRAERTFIHPYQGIGKARAITDQHFEIGEQMMSQGHRLRRLQMRESGHDAIGMLFGSADQRGKQGIDTRNGALHGAAHPHAEIGRHLIVAAAGRVQAPGSGADDLGQAGFGGHVDVLEVPILGYAVAFIFGRDLLQAFIDRLRVSLAHNALLGQHGHMRPASRDILAPERLVERD